MQWTSSGGSERVQRLRAKILIVGHSPSLPTGMAETTRLIFEPLAERYPGRYEIRQVALCHPTANAASKWPIYPSKSTVISDDVCLQPKDDIHGENTYREALTDFDPHLVFAFNWAGGGEDYEFDHFYKTTYQEGMTSEMFSYNWNSSYTTMRYFWDCSELPENGGQCNWYFQMAEAYAYPQ